MKFIKSETIAELVQKAIPHLAYELPADISTELKTAREHEKDSLGKQVLDQLCTNDDIARNDQVPICQDTGSVRVSLQVGPDVYVSGDVFSNINKAVAIAYDKAKLRKSMVKDSYVDRSNTGDNTPAFCDVEMVDEPGTARLNLMIKGGGSDNASRLLMLVPGDGKKGIIDNIVKCVHEKAAAACPPLTLGIGIGSTFDHVATLAQRALFRPVGEPNKNEVLADLEKEILEAVNNTHIGAGALGGSMTVSQVNIISEASHIASMPLAIDMGCSAMRRTSIDIPCSNNIDELVDEKTIDEALQSALHCYDHILDSTKNSVKNVCECGKTECNDNSCTDAIKLQLPLSHEDMKKLKAGDKCLLTGTIYTLRDAGHIRLLEEMEHTGKLPYDLEGQTIYYAGPTPAKSGRPFGAIGPTTATRMDFAAPTLYEKGLSASIGKGKRSKEVHDSCKKNDTVFFVTIGGCAAYLAKCVKSSELIAYEDLGTEALRKLEVKDFPVFVGIDTNGEDIYK